MDGLFSNCLFRYGYEIEAVGRRMLLQKVKCSQLVWPLYRWLRLRLPWPIMEHKYRMATGQGAKAQGVLSRRISSTIPLNQGLLCMHGRGTAQNITTRRGRWGQFRIYSCHCQRGGIQRNHILAKCSGCSFLLLLLNLFPNNKKKFSSADKTTKRFFFFFFY